jgi:hypothetical protein
MMLAPLYTPGTKIFAVAPMIDWTEDFQAIDFS